MIKEAIEKLSLEEIQDEEIIKEKPVTVLTERKIQDIAKELTSWSDGYLRLAHKHGVRRADVVNIDATRKVVVYEKLNPKEEPIDPIGEVRG